ncbi:22587_t:CDS:2 [Dentiscutata erythropus]|uniref:22587_t:CDS:1 n=1 Tax=Dentiscutata erythropus TaxID=1348616 RepID=A0A9N8VPQ0_9GLOM|nr:22587_t:CDS:2 [Dentiscutata erythropus]
MILAREKTYPAWCQECGARYFKENFHNWTSGDENIDKLIREIQLNSKLPVDFVEWIPYENIEEQAKIIGNSGFGTIYEAFWKEGPITGISANESMFKRTKGIQTGYKTGRSPIIRCYGLTKRPVRSCIAEDFYEYMLVLQCAKFGNLKNYISKNFNNMKWLEETKRHKDTKIDNADKLRNIQKVESHTGSELSINIHQNSETNTGSTMSAIENKNIQEAKSRTESELSINIHDLNTESIMFVIENNFMV